MEEFFDFLKILSSVLIIIFSVRFFIKKIRIGYLDYNADKKLGNLMRSGNYELKRITPLPSLLPEIKDQIKGTFHNDIETSIEFDNTDIPKTTSSELKKDDSEYIVEIRLTEEELGYDLMDDPSKFIDRYDIEGFIGLCKTQPFSVLSKIKQKLLENEEFEACEDLDYLIEEKLKHEN